MNVSFSVSSGLMVFGFRLGVIIMNAYTGRVVETLGVSTQEETQALLYYYQWLCDWHDKVIGEELAA